MPQTKRRSVKTPTIFCGRCKLPVKENEEAIECDKCLKTLHAMCTMIDKRQFDQLMSDDKEEYVCFMCNKGCDGNIESELKEIKTKLSKLDQLDALNKLNQLDSLQESMLFMSQKFDDVLKGIKENKKQIDAMRKETNILKAENNELKKTVKFLNDHRVRNDCLISGIENVNSSNAVESVIDIMKKVEVNLKPEDFEAAYYIGKKESKKKMVVAKFETKAAKQKVMSAKMKLGANEETKSIFVNDFLSKETLGLLNHAKALKSVGFRRVYAAGGKVFAKRSELSKPRVINSEDEVDEILLQSTTTRRSRTVQNVEVSDDSDEANNMDYLSPNI
ncbi:uncharacterized protein LOC142228697 [Haematobia irritans]|uniref:uncharacterized protein LOC142228697 n=1 Tax=Haematobia irritans TaxID=7368 RepID=UPI003F50BAC7